ncbi:MAG: transposase [Nitrospinae bacterium]|nr:transposase [Nitrospinota bacterium]
MIVKSNLELEVLPKYPQYERRKPEGSVLYEVVRNNYKTFLEETEMTPKGLSKQAKKEFEGFLTCGILAHGFLRMACPSCRTEFLLGFSCKGRGFCPSCIGRRMAEHAALLVDYVLPVVPMRQWVVTLPFKLRFWTAKNSKLKSAVLKIITRQITSHYRKSGKIEYDIRGGKTAAVTVIQTSGGSINLNPHFHTVYMDGVIEDGRFYRSNAPTDVDIYKVLTKIYSKVVCYLQKKGYFDDCSEVDTEELLMNLLYEASIFGKAALGKDRGKKVERRGVFTGTEGIVRLKSDRCGELDGFSIHANTSVEGHQRDRCEKLLRYIMRPPVANERLSFLEDGRVRYELKRPYSDGTTNLVYTQQEVMERLATIVPPARANIVRYHGLLAPNAKDRNLIIPRCGAVEKDKNDKKVDSTGSGQVRPYRMSWAKILSRVFKTDLSKCQKCGHEVKIIASIIEQGAIVKILKHLGLPHEAPKLSPSRVPAFEFY